jgi:hypothetical protein
MESEEEVRRRHREADKRIEEERLKAHQVRVATMEQIERNIAPLSFSPLDEDPTEHQQLRRQILSEDGERVGHLGYELAGYRYRSKDRFRLSSPRIASRSRYRSGDGQRDYKIVESVIAGIKKFCMPVSNDEKRAKVLRTELQHYREVMRNSYRRSLHIEGNRFGSSPPVDRFIMLLASDIMQDKLEGQEYIRILVRKKRVQTRWSAWVLETFVKPRQEELNALDTSKESLK